MTTVKTTWCVCGRGNSGEPWETVEDGLASCEAAAGWLRTNFAKHPEYSSWYIDREDNDGYAHSYFDARDGELVFTN